MKDTNRRAMFYRLSRLKPSQKTLLFITHHPKLARALIYGTEAGGVVAGGVSLAVPPYGVVGVPLAGSALASGESSRRVLNRTVNLYHKTYIKTLRTGATEKQAIRAGDRAVLKRQQQYQRITGLP